MLIRYSAEDLERLAAKNAAMPEGLKAEDIFYFLAVRSLYHSYSLNLISADKAKAEKVHILEERKQLKFKRELFDHTAEMNMKLDLLMCDINKNGCERCKQFVRVYTGLER